KLFTSIDSEDVVEATDVNSLLKSSIELLDRKFRGNEPEGLKTGFVDLDNQIEGLQPGDLWILAARPSMGKSALAMNIAENVALSGGNVLVFSLEMTKQALMNRMLSSLSKINNRTIRSGKLR